MGAGFSSYSHHGQELYGGTATADDGDPPETEAGATIAAAAASTANGNNNGPASEPKHVIPKTRYRRQQKNKNRAEINIIFNYSQTTLSEAMEEVLNLGLNFAILPKKLDIKQVLKRFERRIIWKEFFYGKETNSEYSPPICKSKKNNLPKNYKIPES